MTEQIKEPSEHNRMAALQLIARQSVTRLAEILDSKDEAIATARKERDEEREAGARLLAEHEKALRVINRSAETAAELKAEVEKWRKELTLCNKERFDAQTQLAEARAEVERLRMACGMAYGIPGAEKIEVDAMRPVEKMQEIVAAVTAEVARLRTAADAWGSCVATAKEIWTFGHERGGERQMLQHVEYLLAGIDARAAKEKGA